MKKLFILFMTALCLSACKNDCPAFPEQLKAYFPYNPGTVLKYRNDGGSILELPIKQVYADGESSYPNCAKCACGAGGGFETELNEKTLMAIKLGFVVENQKDIALNVEFVDSDQHQDQFYLNVISDPYGTDNVFSEPILLQHESYSRFNNVKIEKGKGITEFWDEKSACTWIKVD